MSSVMGAKGQLLPERSAGEPNRRAVRALLQDSNNFAPTPTESIKFPLCGSLFHSKMQNLLRPCAPARTVFSIRSFY